MTDRQAAEARERVSQWPAETEARTLILGLADSVDALSVRLAQTEQERDQWKRKAEDRVKGATASLSQAKRETQAAWTAAYASVGDYEEAVVRLREYEEARGNEYECAHGHRWWMTTEPRRCPDCNTSSFSVAASGGREEPEKTGAGSSAADSSVGERQGRHPAPAESREAP